MYKIKVKTLNADLQKSDFSQHALDLGIWEELTEGLGDNVEQVTLTGRRRAS